MPTEDRLYQRVAQARRAGDDRLMLIYRPAEWWDALYHESPAKYYSRKYELSTALLCKVCQNHRCGWNKADIETVDRANHHNWVCPTCTASLERLKKKPLEAANYRQLAQLPRSSPLPGVRYKRRKMFEPTTESSEAPETQNGARVCLVTAPAL